MIDTILLIARAILAVLYSRVIHSLKDDSDQPGFGVTTPVPAVDIPAMIDQALAEQAARFEERLTDLITGLKAEQTVRFEEHLTDLAFSLKAEQARLFADLQRVLITPDNGTATSGTPASGTSTNGTHASGTRQPRTTTSGTTGHSVPTRQLLAGRSHMLLMSERKQQAPTISAEHTPTEIATDKVVWPLLDTGKTVRAIAEETTITRSAVGRSRVRWAAANGTSDLSQDNDESHETTTTGTSDLSQEQAG